MRTVYRLTEPQWEFFYTCWRYNLDFYRGHNLKVQRRFNIGVPLYYYLMGRRMFGSAMKYPALRLAHFPESYLSKHLYLDLREDPKYRVPDRVDIPIERHARRSRCWLSRHRPCDYTAALQRNLPQRSYGK